MGLGDVLSTLSPWVVIYAISNDVSNVDSEVLERREGAF